MRWLAGRSSNGHEFKRQHCDLRREDSSALPSMQNTNHAVRSQQYAAEAAVQVAETPAFGCGEVACAVAALSAFDGGGFGFNVLDGLRQRSRRIVRAQSFQLCVQAARLL